MEKKLSKHLNMQVSSTSASFATEIFASTS